MNKLTVSSAAMMRETYKAGLLLYCCDSACRCCMGSEGPCSTAVEYMSVTIAACTHKASQSMQLLYDGQHCKQNSLPILQGCQA